MRLRPSTAAAIVFLGLVCSTAAHAQPIVYNSPLRVCADPANLPYSNKAGQGFENRLADMLAQDLGTTVAYTWYPEHSGFVGNTLAAGECDIIMGMPAIDGVETTRSYYRSSYVFVSRVDRHITLSSMSDPALSKLRIGVGLVGADGAGTPPAVALGRQGIVNNVRGFPVYGDGKSPADPITAVAHGDIDLAAVWGPIAGYYAKSSSVPLRITPITDTEPYLPQTFQFPIAMAFRPGDRDLRDRLNAFITKRRTDIRQVLQDYGVPLL